MEGRSTLSPYKKRNVKHIGKKIRGLLGVAHSFPPDVPKDLCGSKPPRTSSPLATAYPQMLSPSDTNPPHYSSTPITSGFGNTGCDPPLKDPLLRFLIEKVTHSVKFRRKQHWHWGGGGSLDWIDIQVICDVSAHFKTRIYLLTLTHAALKWLILNTLI